MRSIQNTAIVLVIGIWLGLFLPQPTYAAPPPLSNEKLLEEVSKRAFRFFWEKTNKTTGLTNDRARNVGKDDDYTVASIASTGYALASLPIAVERKWVERKPAYDRALLTLRYLAHKMTHHKGWYFHFVDCNTGVRVWNSEVSTIDTTLLMAGALLCGQYWRGTEVDRLATQIFERLDWTWMRTNGGTKPDKKTVSHGWKPESGFLNNDWDAYCELMTLYLLGMGQKRDPLPAESWKAWQRNEFTYGGRKTLAGGPIFLHQMAHDYFNFKNKKDALGWNYSNVSLEAIRIHQEFCETNPKKRKSYSKDRWAINASDGPDGYRAFAPPNDEDGTLSPTGALACLQFTPDRALSSAQHIYRTYGDKLWGRYGFGNAFNLDRNWFDEDVIGIDLGMALLAIENYRTGRVWKWMAQSPVVQRGWEKAGFAKQPSKVKN